MNLPDNNMVAALLGDSAETCDALKRRFQGRIHIFGKSCRLSLRLSPFVRFHRVSGMNAEILPLYLKDFADRRQDCLTVVAASPEYCDLLDSISTKIESSCIILHKESEF